MDYRNLCENVCRIAGEAGDFIARQRLTFSFDRVEHKGAQDLVSYVDKETEKMVVKELRELLPEAGFITEEGTVEKATGQRYKWVIDPLDGTTNFVHGLAPYCVSLALTEDDKPVVGVVYEVTHKECFYAWKDSAAYLNGREIRASTIGTLTDSLIGMGLSHASDDSIPELLRHMDYFLRHTNGVRRLGSAAADLAYVACGRFDGFYQKNLSPWDVAAGALIARQAGARVTDFAGGDNYVFGREIIASNSSIYDSFRQRILD